MRSSLLVLSLAGVCLTACSLDFERFHRAHAPSDDDAGDAASRRTVPDASAEFDAGDARDAAGPCAAVRCGVHAFCAETRGTASCSCELGYARKGSTCVDIDECATNHGGCDPNATCTQSSHAGQPPACACKTAYLGNGTHCTPKVVQLATGGSSTCAISADGALWCWGDNAYGQLGLGSTAVSAEVLSPTRVGQELGWTRVAVGSASCGIRNGALYCWGANSVGQLGLGDEGAATTRFVPTQVGSATDWVEVSMGGSGACGIRAAVGKRTLYCWGRDVGATDQTSPALMGAFTDWDEVSRGSGHGCALRQGQLYCFGTDYAGELGQGSLTSGTLLPTPTQVGTRNDFTHVSAGVLSSCAVTTLHKLVCWGGGHELPFTNSSTYSLDPTELGTWADWQTVALSLSEGPSCGLRNSGAIWCWNRGPNFDPYDPNPARVGTLDGYASVVPAGGFGCALRAGVMACWGDNRAGQLGVGNALPLRASSPKQLGTEQTWTAISAGYRSTCGIQAGKLMCWGFIAEQRFGTPQRLGSASTWTRVSTQDIFSVGLSAANPQRWGLLSTANGSTWIDAPESDATYFDWTAISASPAYLATRCGIRGPGSSLYCWGANSQGQLGVGDKTERTTASAVGSSQTWQAVDLGENYACGIDAGKLYCWGGNSSGELGLGDSGSGTERIAPTQVGSATTWTSVAASVGRSCGIQAGGLYCWGAGLTPLPTRIGSATDYASVTLESSFTCAVHASGVLDCWGDNAFGQLGLGEAAYKTKVDFPTTVPGKWSITDAGRTHTCGIKTDGTLWCWGTNTNGELGIGPSWSDLPLDVSWN